MNEDFINELYQFSGGANIGTYDEFVNELKNSKDFQQELYNAVGGSTVGTYDEFLGELGLTTPYPAPAPKPAPAPQAGPLAVDKEKSPTFSIEGTRDAMAKVDEAIKNINKSKSAPVKPAPIVPAPSQKKPAVTTITPTPQGQPQFGVGRSVVELQVTDKGKSIQNEGVISSSGALNEKKIKENAWLKNTAKSREITSDFSQYKDKKVDPNNLNDEELKLRDEIQQKLKAEQEVFNSSQYMLKDKYGANVEKDIQDLLSNQSAVINDINNLEKAVKNKYQGKTPSNADIAPLTKRRAELGDNIRDLVVQQNALNAKAEELNNNLKEFAERPGVTEEEYNRYYNEINKEFTNISNQFDALDADIGRLNQDYEQVRLQEQSLIDKYNEEASNINSQYAADSDVQKLKTKLGEYNKNLSRIQKYQEDPFFNSYLDSLYNITDLGKSYKNLFPDVLEGGERSKELAKLARDIVKKEKTEYWSPQNIFIDLYNGVKSLYTDAPATGVFSTLLNSLKTASYNIAGDFIGAAATISDVVGAEDIARKLRVGDLYGANVTRMNIEQDVTRGAVRSDIQGNPVEEYYIVKDSDDALFSTGLQPGDRVILEDGKPVAYRDGDRFKKNLNLIPGTNPDKIVEDFVKGKPTEKDSILSAPFLVRTATSSLPSIIDMASLIGFNYAAMPRISRLFTKAATREAAGLAANFGMQTFQQYGDLYSSYLQKGLSPGDAAKYALGQSAGVGLIEIANPLEMKVASLGGPAAVNLFRKIIDTSVDLFARGKIGTKDLISNIGIGAVTALKEAGIEGGTELIQGEFENIVENYATNGNKSTSMNDSINTVATTLAVVFLPSISMGRAAYRNAKSDVITSSIFKAAQNKEQFLKDLDKAVGEGKLEISEAVGIKNYVEYIKDELDEYGTITDNQGAALTGLIGTRYYYENKKKNSTNETAKKEIDKKIEEINKTIQDVVSGTKKPEVDPFVAEFVGEKAAPAAKEATVKEDINTKKAYDFDDTLFDNKTGKLTTLGEDVKKRIEAGEDIVIVTARGENQTQQIQDVLGIGADKIEATGDEAKKPEALQKRGISPQEYYDENQEKLAAIQGVAAPSTTAAGAMTKEQQAELDKVTKRAERIQRTLQEDAAVQEEGDEPLLTAEQKQKLETELQTLNQRRDAIQKQSTAEVPVQPGAETRPGVGGQVQAKPEGPAGKGKGKGKEVEGEKAGKVTNVSIGPPLDEDGEVDYEAEDAVRQIAKSRNLGITRDREIASVARDENGNIVGGAFTSYDDTTGEYTFDVVVSEDYDGTGIGSKLLDSVINLPSDIKDMNPKAKVKVDVVNPRMKNMLEQRGFKVTKKIGDDRFIMEPSKKTPQATKAAEPTPTTTPTEKVSPKAAKAPQKPNTVQGFEITRQDGSKLPASDYTKDKKTGKWKRVAADGTTKGVSFAPYVKQLEDALSSQSRAAAETKKTEPTPTEVAETPVPKNKVRASFNIENAGRLKTIQTTPTFKNIFSEEQLKNLKVGENTVDLNMTAWGKAQRMLDAKDVTKKTEPTPAKEEDIANELAKANNISKTQAKTLSAVINTVKKNIAKRLGISLPEYRRRTAIRVVPNITQFLSDIPNSIHSLRGLSSDIINDFTNSVREASVAFQDAFGKVNQKYVKNNGLKADDYIMSAILDMDNAGVFKFLGFTDKLSALKIDQIREALNNRLLSISDKAKNSNDFYIQDLSRKWIQNWQKRATTEIEKETAQSLLDGNEEAMRIQIENIQSQQRANLMASLNYLIPSNDYTPEFKFLMIALTLKGNTAKPAYIRDANDNIIDTIPGKDLKRTKQTVGNHQELSSMVLPSVYAEMQRGSGSHPMELIDKHTDKSIIGRDETWELVKDRVFKKADGGYWIKFEKSNEDSDIQALTLVSKKVQKVMAPDDNPWCTGGGMAANYLPKGDFYLFLDENLDPQITVRYEGNQISELRGTDKGQALSESQANIAEKFLDNIPNGKDYKNQVKASRVYHKLNNGINPTSLQDLKDFFDVWGVELDTYDDEKIEKFKDLKNLNLNTYVELNEKYKLYDVIKRSDVVFKDTFVTKNFTKKYPNSSILKQKMLILGDINFYGFSDRFLPEGLEIKGSVRLTGSIELPKNLKIDGSLFLTGEEIPFGFTLPEGLQVGKDLNFDNTTLPQGFTLPKGLKVNGDLSFYGATLPQGFTLPEGLQVGGYLDFGNTTLPQGFTLPEGLKVSRDLSFYGAILPQGFTLPKGLKVDGDLSFYGATLPQGFKLPEDLKVGWVLSFSGVTLPQGFTLPEGLKVGGYLSFNSATLPQGFTLPKGLQVGGDLIFYEAILPQGFKLPKDLKVGRDLIFIDAKYTDGTSAEDIFKEWEIGRSVAQQDSRGAIVETPTSTIILLDKDNADVTTPIHEIAHEYEKVLTADERKVMEDWSGAKFGTTKFREAFAKGAERYLYEGASFNGKVDAVFEKLKNWFKKVITDAINYFGDINQLTPEVREVYSKMLIDGDMDVVEAAAPSQAAAEAETATAETVLEPIGKTSAEREKQIEKFFTAAAGKDKAESSQMAKLTNNIWNSVAKFFGARNAQTANEWIQSKVALIGKTTTTEAGKLGIPRFQAPGKINWERSPEGKGDPSISSRNPIVQQAAKDLKDGKITNEEYRAVASENSPIRPITRFFEPATDAEIKRAFEVSTKKDSEAELINEPLTNGERVGLRLDIPSYNFNNTWVVSVHDGNTKAGKIKSYRNVAKIKNVEFSTSPKAALNIASGEVAKTTIARMFGDWVEYDGKNSTEKAKNAKEEIQAIANDKNWVQIGMNPFRHSYFYDRSNDLGRPVMSAEEVVQIGGLVYAKNPVYGDWTDESFAVKDLFDAAGKQVQFQGDTDNPYTFAEAAEAVANNLITEIDRMIKDRSNLANIKKRGFTKSQAAAQVKELKKIKEDLLQAKKDPKFQADERPLKNKYINKHKQKIKDALEFFYKEEDLTLEDLKTEDTQITEGEIQGRAIGNLYYGDELDENQLEDLQKNYENAISRTSTYRGNLYGHAQNALVFSPIENDLSSLVGMTVNDIFIVSHFSPTSLRKGVELIQMASDSNMPIVMAVPEYQANQLEKAGFNFLFEVPQIFGGEIIMKKVMVNDAFKLNEMVTLAKYNNLPESVLDEIIDDNQFLIRYQQDAAKFRAAVITTAQNKLIVAALESPNASSFVHEGFHMFEGDLTADEKQTIIDSYNDSFGEKETEFTTDVSEWGARMWEKYFSNGRQLTAAEVKDTKKRKALQEIFDKFTEWLKGVYEGVINYTNTKGVTREVFITPEVQALFDNIMGITPSPAAAETKATTEAKTAEELSADIQASIEAEAAKEQEAIAKAFEGNKKQKAANDLIKNPKSAETLPQDLLEELYNLAAEAKYTPALKKKCD